MLWAVPEEYLQIMKQKNLTESEYRQRIKELEEALEYERLRNYAYEKLIEITEKEEGITILKKGDKPNTK